MSTLASFIGILNVAKQALQLQSTNVAAELALPKLQYLKNRREITMGTERLFRVLLVAFFAITLCSISYAQENRILMTSEQQYQNMVPNSSFESWDSTNTKPSDWTKIDTPTLSQDASVIRIGAKALKITSSAGTTSQGVSYAVTVEPKTTYTFSCYYYSAVANQAEVAVVGNVTANLVADTVLASTTAAWKRYAVTFTTVTDTSATIKLYAKADVGGAKSAYFDAVALSEGSSTPAFIPHAITDTGDHTMYGGLTVYGTADLKGHVNLGDLSTDNITLKGTLKSDTGANVTITPPANQTVSITQGGLSVTGTVTADGLTLGANENITLGTQTISHNATDFQFSDAIDLGTNVLDDTNLGYFLGWKHASDGTKLDGGDIYTGTVTTTEIATDTIAAGDIATGAVATAEILDGTIAPADIGMLRLTAQSTPDKTVAVASGAVYVSGNTLINFTAQNANLAAFDPVAADKYVKALVTLNSSGTLSFTTGTEYALAGKSSAEGESLTYPVDGLPIAELILKTTGTAAGAIANIESSDAGNSYIYRDVRPFINVGGGSSTAAATFTIGSTTNETTGDVVLAFGNSGPETLRFDGDNTDNFVFSDAVDADGYNVAGVALASSHLSDGANIAHINAAEVVTGGWTFNTANTTFTTAIDVNTESTMAGLNIDATGVLKMAGTTVMDASRNMSSIGTISSTGNYTLDGDLAFAGPQSITTSTGDLTLNPAGAVAIGAKTISGTTAVIDFSNFDVSSTGAVTAAGAITSASGAVMDSIAATDNATVNAPTIILRGSYDGNVGIGVTATDYDTTLAHILTAGGASPASKIEIDVGGGGAEMTLTSAGGLSVTGTINSQTIGASSSFAALTTSGDLAVNQNSGVADDVYFAVQHNSGNIFTVDKEGDLYISGNLQVEGTQTILNVQTVEVESSAIKMNRNVTGSPVLNASIVAERGTSADTSLRWNETGDIWDITMDGTNYYGILHTNTDLAGDVSGKYNNLQLGADVVGASELASTAIQIGDIEAGDLPADGYASTYVNVGAGGDTMTGSLTAASFAFDNSTLNAEQWSTASGDITLGPAGANILPSSDGTIDLGLGAVIETMSAIASEKAVGPGTISLSTSGAWTTYVDNNLTYRVEIGLGGATGAATYKWSRDGGSTWVATGVATAAAATALENGLSIAFSATGTAVLGDYWDITITKNTGYKNVFANTITTDDVYTPSIRPENTSGTVTLTGSLSITGDLNVTGAQNITGGTVYTGQEIVRLDHAQALLVEKAGADGSGTDIFFIDTIDQNAELYSALGIGKTPASGIELDVSGDADFSGTLKAGTADAFQVAATGAVTAVGVNAGSGLVTTSGNITTTGAGTITAANGLTVSAGGASVSGGLNNNTGNITNAGAISGATTVVASSYVRSLASVGLIPEYDNATPRGDGADNFGTLSLQYANSHNYYEWTTSEPTTQDYDIVIRYRLPDGFSSFDATTPIKLWNKVSATPGATKVDVTMLDTAGASVTLTGGSTLQNTSWTESTITIGGTPTFTAGGYITITIKMSADQGKVADVGELTLKGNW